MSDFSWNPETCISNKQHTIIRLRNAISFRVITKAFLTLNCPQNSQNTLKSQDNPVTGSLQSLKSNKHRGPPIMPVPAGEEKSTHFMCHSRRPFPPQLTGKHEWHKKISLRKENWRSSFVEHHRYGIYILQIPRFFHEKKMILFWMHRR